MPRSDDADFLARDAQPEDVRVARAEGNFIVDDSGKRYIDFFMGWSVGIFGWGHHAIRDAVRAFDGPAYVYPHFHYQRWNDLARLLVEMTPPNLTRCFRATGGTEAVEIALKAAMIHTGRRGILSVEGSYHGNSLGALSVGASENRASYPNLLPHCDKIELPLDRRALFYVENRLRDGEIAAILMEPIFINLGVYVPDPEFMRGVGQLCKKFGTLLILDEVATGFGRTGKLFACEHFDLAPDILCLGKALSGGYGGLGATVVSDAVALSARRGVNAYSTFGWHPFSVEAAIANLTYLGSHKDALLGNVAVMSDRFRERLTKLKCAPSAELSVHGLAIAIKLGHTEQAKDVCRRCRENGLLIASDGSTLLLLPALNVDEETAREGLDILEASIGSGLTSWSAP